MGFQSNSNRSKEFPKEDGSLTDISKKDNLWLTLVAGTGIDSMLYVLLYSSPPPLL